MRKIICLILILFLVGCGRDKYITCDIEVENEVQNYTLTGQYKIYYKNNYVTKIEEYERFSSFDKSVINYLDESKNLDYYNLKDMYGGYEYEIQNKTTSVTLNSYIDMNLVNIKQMVIDKKIDKDYVLANKLTTSGAVMMYEAKGAICDI